MRIFTFFDACLRGDSPRHQPATTPGIAHCLCVIPATAGFGHRCEYVHLCAGDRHPAATSDQPEWWACMQGGLLVVDSETELAVLASGDVHTPEAGRAVEVQAVVDSVLVRAVPEAGAGSAGTAEFVAIDAGEADWAQQLHARGLNWAVCHHGALSLQWRASVRPDEVRTTYLQPGMAFAPEPGDDYCIDAILSGAGLLCCLQPPPASGAVPLPQAERKAA
ncbi:MAG: hypothetical protein JO067_11745 [Cupriavidus sp.]|nr:hypothetical protein [Cupriavidus sp.]